MTPPSMAEEPVGQVGAALRECPGCGLFQIEPVLAPGTTAALRTLRNRAAQGAASPA